MKLTTALTLCLMLTGCGFAMKSLPPQNVPIDQHPYTPARGEVTLLALPVDDCGACQTNSPVINPPMQRVVILDFDLSEQVNVIGIDETTNGADWRTVYLDQPHLWIGAGHKQVRLTNLEPYAFYRAWVKNEP